MTFDGLHQTVTYLMAGLGLFAVTLGGDLQLPLRIVITLGFVASWFVDERFWGRPSATRILNAAVVSVLAVQVLRGLSGAAYLGLGLEFATLLQLSRLFHRRSARDYQHIQALAFLHLIAATVLTTGVDYGVAFLGFVLVTPWMLALTHLRSEIEAQHAEPGRSLYEGPSERARQLLRSPHIAGPRFLAGTAALAMPLFLATAAFFLLFPRVGMGFLSFGLDTGRSVAGFGSDVELGGFGVIRSDPTVVLRVTPRGLAQGGEAPARSFRFRGTSFDRYEGGRWTRSRSGSRPLDHQLGYYPLSGPRGNGTEELDVVLDSIDESVVFLPTGTVGIEVAPRVSAGRERYRRLSLSRGVDLRYVDMGGLGLRYTAHVMPGAPIPELLAAEDAQRYTALPPGQERIAALARQLAGEGSAATKAERLTTWLRDSEELRYTLDQPDTAGRDPLEVFLFEAKAGHCEYFSTSLAVMLRALDVPARNVTGFVGGTWNQYGRYYALRQGDAHSWVEAWIDGAWQTLDPTPQAFTTAGPAPGGLFAELQAFLDAMRVRWNQSVVGYDLRDQVSGLRSMWSWMKRQGLVGGGGGAATASDEGPQRAAQRPTGLPTLVLALLALGLVVLVAAWRWRRRGRGAKKPAGRATQLYARLERALAKAGAARPAGRTPMEHVAHLEACRHPAATPAAEVTQAYLAARFGDAPLGDEAALREKIRQVRSARPPEAAE
ncbi:MAG: DUF3488 and transglutaminase-like domain-containing protein [Myxococcota bacterium]